MARPLKDTGRANLVLVWGAVFSVLMATIACSSDAKSNQPSPLVAVEPTQPAPLVSNSLGEAWWDTSSGESVESMVERYPYVFVGRVDAARVDYANVFPEPDSFDNIRTVEGKRPVDRVLQYPFSLLAVVVDESLGRSPLEAGTTITIYQVGGYIVSAKTGEAEHYHIEGDHVLEVGSRYLIFASDARATPGALSLVPWGKFIVDDQDMIRPINNDWLSLPSVSSLEGRTLTNATTIIAQARESVELDGRAP